MKKFLCTLLCIVLVFSMMPMVTGVALAEGNVEDTFTVDGIKYNITSTLTNTVEVSVNKTSTATSITIPATVTSGTDVYTVTKIGKEAFNRCASLTSIEIPASVENIEENAFFQCKKLINVSFTDILESKLESIGKNAFKECASLTSIEIPASVENIEEGAFYDCKKLINVSFTDIIKSKLKSIGAHAFQTCSITNITIPTSVTSIGDSAFDQCKNLATVSFTNISESKLTSIGEQAFLDCNSLENITIPASVTSIGGGAFQRCNSLTEINIPDGVSIINSDTFHGCSKLRSITIPASVASISNFAFAQCASLTDITIPASVTSIGNMAFAACSSLESVTCLPTTPPTLGANAFDGCSSEISIYVPSEAVASYTSATGWTSYKNKIKSINWNLLAKAMAWTTPTDATTLTTVKDANGKELFSVVDGEDTRTIKLLTDITAGPADSALVVPSGKNIVLDLNGHVLDRGLIAADGTVTTNTNGSVIEVNGGELTIEDSAPTVEHAGYIDENGLWHLGEGAGTPTLIYGGIITGGTGYIYKTDEESTQSGGGININFEASAVMNGGNIVGNFADIGAGVLINYNLDSPHETGTFKMTNGTICGNRAQVYGGGIQNGGELYLEAPEGKSINIINNTAIEAEGGVANWDTMYLSGKVIIKDNICSQTDYPKDLANGDECNIIVTGSLEGSDINIVHASGTDEPNAGVLTASLTDTNPGVKLGDFFHYNGPDNYYMALNDSGELEVFGVPNGSKKISIDSCENGAVTANSQYAASGTNVTLTVTPNTGYELATFTSTPSNITFTASGTDCYTFMMPEENVTITPTFKANTYTVTFEPQGGTVSPTNTNVTYDAKFGTLPVPTRAGYTFDGWYSSPTDGTKYTSDTDVKITTDTNIYAHWTINSYTVTFDANGRGTAPEATSTNYNTTITEPASPTEIGYTFNGWYKDASCTDGNEWNFETATVTSDTNLYAKWTANTYTISFDMNGGDGVTPTDKEVTYGGTYGELHDATRTGYTFEGWWTSATDGTQVTSATKVAITAPQTLYAHWKANNYQVIFNPQGGTVSPTNTNVTYDAKFGPLPVPTRAGYTFDGWYSSPTNGTKYTSDTNVKLTTDTNIYAHWTVIPSIDSGSYFNYDDYKKILEEAQKQQEELDKKKAEEEKLAEHEKLVTEAKAALAETEFKATSTKQTKLNGKKAIKVKWEVVGGPYKLEDFEGFDVFRSTKRYSGFGTKPFFTTKNWTYTNNKDLKVGKTYYYKVRAWKMVDGEKVYTGWSTKAWRTVK